MRLFRAINASYNVKCNIVLFSACGVIAMAARFAWSLMDQISGPKQGLVNNLVNNGYLYPAMFTSMLCVSELLPVLYYVVFFMH